jgi:chloramphenicol-sensitive protein RarD
MNRFAGVLFLLGGIVLWGLFPIYWKQLVHLNDVEVLAHRILWSVPFLGLVIFFARNTAALWQAFRPPRRIGVLFLSSLMITCNWGLYIWAIGADKVVEASMGYFLSPLMTVLLGMTVFKETLSTRQWLAVGIAGVAVGGLFVTRDVAPWLAVTLGASFAGYNALRKLAAEDSVVGLFIETLFLMPFAFVFIVYLLATGNAGFVQHGSGTLLLALAAGLVTATPLVLFVAGSRRMPLSNSGLLFYLTPTIQFFIGVFLYREALPVADFIAFVAIWSALAIFAADGYIASRNNHRQLPRKSNP